MEAPSRYRTLATSPMRLPIPFAQISANGSRTSRRARRGSRAWPGGARSGAGRQSSSGAGGYSAVLLLPLKAHGLQTRQGRAHRLVRTETRTVLPHGAYAVPLVHKDPFWGNLYPNPTPASVALHQSFEQRLNSCCYLRLIFLCQRISERQGYDALLWMPLQLGIALKG